MPDPNKSPYVAFGLLAWAVAMKAKAGFPDLEKNGDIDELAWRRRDQLPDREDLGEVIEDFRDRYARAPVEAGVILHDALIRMMADLTLSFKRTQEALDQWRRDGVTYAWQKRRDICG